MLSLFRFAVVDSNSRESHQIYIFGSTFTHTLDFIVNTFVLCIRAYTQIDHAVTAVTISSIAFMFISQPSESNEYQSTQPSEM